MFVDSIDKIPPNNFSHGCCIILCLLNISMTEIAESAYTGLQVVNSSQSNSNKLKAIAPDHASKSEKSYKKKKP